MTGVQTCALPIEKITKKEIVKLQKSKDYNLKKEILIHETTSIEQEMKSKDKTLSYEGKDIYVLAKNVITCLEHISEDYYFGINVLINVIRGGEGKQIRKHQLDNVPEYGIYADLSKDDIRAVIEWMLDKHYMLKTKANYPVLHQTYEGNHFDECITKVQLRDLKRYLNDPNREVFQDDKDDNRKI